MVVVLGVVAFRLFEYVSQFGGVVISLVGSGGGRIVDLGLWRGSLAPCGRLCRKGLLDWCASMVVVSGCIVCGCGSLVGYCGVSV